MLDYLREGEAAGRIRKALDSVVGEGKSLAGDLVGKASTRVYKDALVDALVAEAQRADCAWMSVVGTRYASVMMSPKSLLLRSPSSDARRRRHRRRSCAKARRRVSLKLKARSRARVTTCRRWRIPPSQLRYYLHELDIRVRLVTRDGRSAGPGFSVGLAPRREALIALSATDDHGVALLGGERFLGRNTLFISGRGWVVGLAGAPEASLERENLCCLDVELDYQLPKIDGIRSWSSSSRR